jgi:hypothetical protein
MRKISIPTLVYLVNNQLKSRKEKRRKNNQNRLMRKKNEKVIKINYINKEKKGRIKINLYIS